MMLSKSERASKSRSNHINLETRVSPAWPRFVHGVVRVCVSFCLCVLWQFDSWAGPAISPPRQRKSWRRAPSRIGPSPY